MEIVPLWMVLVLLGAFGVVAALINTIMFIWGVLKITKALEKAQASFDVSK